MKKNSSHNFTIRKKSKPNFMLRFLVNMQYAFEDRENLYLVIDLMSGGDLRYHIGKYRRFSEE
jgi:serine/threonine protein kinase